MRAAACSIASALTGLFSSALVMPALSLCSSNGSRLPALLTTRGITSSAVSNVVKRSAQRRHSRRRRIWLPSVTRRESVTLVSLWPQKGQCIDCPAQTSVVIDGETPAQLLDLGPHAIDRALCAAGL